MLEFQNSDNSSLFINRRKLIRWKLNPLIRDDEIRVWKVNFNIYGNEILIVFVSKIVITDIVKECILTSTSFPTSIWGGGVAVE